jgi:hypothetical protein
MVEFGVDVVPLCPASSPHLSYVSKEFEGIGKSAGPEKAAPCVIYGLSRNENDKNGGGLL